MIDLHSHSLLSDGVLLPSELIRRAEVQGYQYWAITDHGDVSNLDHIVPRIVSVARELNKNWKIKVLPGIELTHVPPETMAGLVQRARELGARIVVVHGETISEPVPPGTNRAAIEAGVNVLAHPGLILMEEVRLAAQKGVYLEVTSRKGHSLTNGHVVRLARAAGAGLVLNSDTHSPDDIVPMAQRERVVEGAGLEKEDLMEMDERSVKLFEKLADGL
ncbi:MAG TPA: histidinol phosphate phosphatase domain-containing protein [Thermodesulfobacteriota bacterium]|nr:histidinol phosphate phosphatase domain-containing protein [Thermodesulfobacteriota bacterium]